MYNTARVATEPLRGFPRLLTTAGAATEKKEVEEDKGQALKRKKSERAAKKAEKAAEKDEEGTWRHLRGSTRVDTNSSQRV